MPSTAQLRSAALVLVPGAGAVYLAFRSGGAAAGLAAIAAVAFAGMLALRLQTSTVDRELVGRLAHGVLLALPGALILYFSFNAGGFYPGTTGLVAIVLALLLVVRVTTAEDPFAGFGWPLAAAAAALAALALWTLLSASWSDAPARALLEFDRTLCYLLALLLLGSLPRRSDRLRWIVRGLALAITAVAVAGLLSRTLPDTFPVAPNIGEYRLSYPLTYWNALGILASIGALLCIHLSASLREPLAIRVAAAAAVPALASTLLLTYSRGAIGAGIVGLALYAILGRPRGLLTGAVAIVPASAVALVSVYDADLLASNDPTTAAATAQGHDVAVTVLACVLAAALLRAVLAPVDVRLRRFRLPRHLRRRVLGSAWAASTVVVVAVLLVANVPDRLSDQYDRFVNATRVATDGKVRDRLTDPTSAPRVASWRVARKGYASAKLKGEGAGTYALRWTRKQPEPLEGLALRDAHSLYLEMLDELGLVGFLLLGVAVLAVLASFMPVGRGRNRSLYAVLAATGVMWAIHAGVDWDWEMPAVTVWFFAVGGAALATHERRRIGSAPAPGVRLGIGLALVVAAAAPAVVLASQRQLDTAADAFQRGDCGETIDAAVASIEALESRPEPYEALGFCQVRAGNPQLAVPALERAVDRDPKNWEFLYGLALVRGAAGLDPRPSARAAKRLGPRQEVVADLLDELRRGGRGRWKRLTTARATNETLSVVR